MRVADFNKYTQYLFILQNIPSLAVHFRYTSTSPSLVVTMRQPDFLYRKNREKEVHVSLLFINFFRRKFVLTNVHVCPFLHTVLKVYVKGVNYLFRFFHIFYLLIYIYFLPLSLLLKTILRSMDTHSEVITLPWTYLPPILKGENTSLP